MPQRTTQQILDREFLEIRGKILELAASFDRMDRSDGEADPRMVQIANGLKLLIDERGDKAERVQLLFSREYTETWRRDFGI